VKFDIGTARRGDGQDVFAAPRAGGHVPTARVAALQECEEFRIAATEARQPVEFADPCRTGRRLRARPIEPSPVRERNFLHFEFRQGSRRASIKRAHPEIRKLKRQIICCKNE
jgi:hypothetical protein